MDEMTRRLLRVALPNFPDALAEEWLAPYVIEEGPPTSSGRWLRILAGKSLDFWRSVSWRLETVDLVVLLQTRLTPASSRSLSEMEMGYFEGVSNPYSLGIPDGKERTLSALSFLQEHQIFPSPPAFLCHPDGMMDIMDGNHRILAFVRAMKMYPPSAKRNQDAWIGRYSDLPQPN